MGVRALISTMNKARTPPGRTHLLHFEWQVFYGRSSSHLPTRAAVWLDRAATLWVRDKSGGVRGQAIKKANNDRHLTYWHLIAHSCSMSPYSQGHKGK